MKKVLSIVMAMLMLASSTGIAYAQHYCGEYKMLSEITLGEKHLSCGMAMELPGCDEEQEEPGCCDNEYTKVETDDTFEKSSFEIDFSPVFLEAFVSVFILKSVELPKEHDFNFKQHDPPPLDEDLQVLYETFLI